MIDGHGNASYRDTPSWIGCDAVLEPVEQRIDQLGRRESVTVLGGAS